METQR